MFTRYAILPTETPAIELVETTPKKLPVDLFVYIAGPYTQGNINFNVDMAIRFGDFIEDLGFTVYIPHLTHFWEERYYHPVEFWYEHDLKWLAKCDILFRISGPSVEADNEERFAREHGITVIYTIDELMALIP